MAEPKQPTRPRITGLTYPPIERFETAQQPRSESVRKEHHTLLLGACDYQQNVLAAIQGAEHKITIARLNVQDALSALSMSHAIPIDLVAIQIRVSGAINELDAAFTLARDIRKVKPDMKIAFISDDRSGEVARRSQEAVSNSILLDSSDQLSLEHLFLFAHEPEPPSMCATPFSPQQIRSFNLLVVAPERERNGISEAVNAVCSANIVFAIHPGQVQEILASYARAGSGFARVLIRVPPYMQPDAARTFVDSILHLVPAENTLLLVSDRPPELHDAMKRMGPQVITISPLGGLSDSLRRFVNY